jgi:hypothetical protein
MFLHDKQILPLSSTLRMNSREDVIIRVPCKLMERLLNRVKATVTVTSSCTITACMSDIDIFLGEMKDQWNVRELRVEKKYIGSSRCR